MPNEVVPAAFTPTVDQIQALLSARETFTGSTVPTATQVAQIAADNANELAGEITAMPPALVGLATSVVRYKTAADVEVGTWPEQSSPAGASGGIWYARYVQAHDRLIAQLKAYGDTAPTSGSMATPSATLLAAQNIAAGVPDPNPDVAQAFGDQDFVETF